MKPSIECVKRLLFASFKRTLSSITVKRAFSGRFLRDLQARGLVSRYFPEKDEIHNCFTKQQTFYAGFDPTADSLHLGNMLVLMALLHCARNGHRVICVIGEQTARVGDPSDKTCTRPEIEYSTLKRNSELISSTINKIFSNHYKYFSKTSVDGKTPIEEPIVISNESWYKNQNLISFLVNVGKFLPLSEMVARDYVKKRLPNVDLNFAEFSYQAIQAYDWYFLFNKYDCKFQIGGSDQEGNAVIGYRLIRKKTQEEIPCYGIFLPLIVNEKGSKIGKTNSSAVIWLHKSRLSSYNFYQALIQTPDKDVELYLKLFTFLSLHQIQDIVRKHFQDPDRRYGQRLIAENLTLLVHGEEGLKNAQLATKAIFENDIESFGKLNDETLCEVFGEDTLITKFMEPGTTNILDIALRTGHFSSTLDAVNIIEEGGFYLNHNRIKAPSKLIEEKDILPNNTSLIRIVVLREVVEVIGVILDQEVEAVLSEDVLGSVVREVVGVVLREVVEVIGVILDQEVEAVLSEDVLGSVVREVVVGVVLDQEFEAVLSVEIFGSIVLKLVEVIRGVLLEEVEAAL
ncbi:tyrosine--tRNA ligase-like protein [Dinothrombium tinctorium]|uniref:Tyrosine--tRNA ligase n=1 Tax=Dinothrombium tinctorium TaxID=1965070 RepID=A0A3S3NY00_9ACAR|nr:tyrosine--tRNA ligase-like protein [Dinothrombium tinctorium]